MKNLKRFLKKTMRICKKYYEKIDETVSDKSFAMKKVIIMPNIF